MKPLPVSQFLNKTIEEGALNVVVACVSAVTGEEGGMMVTNATTLDEVMRQYAIQFPKESSAYLAKIKSQNLELHNRSGMSAGGRMMKLTEIPEFVLWAMRAKQREYWDTKERIYNFIRSYPAFMVGDKTVKQTKGVVIK